MRYHVEAVGGIVVAEDLKGDLHGSGALMIFGVSMPLLGSDMSRETGLGSVPLL